MANNSGNDTKFQIGLESSEAYGTAAEGAVQLEMLSESLGETHNTVESDALVGAVTTPYFNIIGKKVEGDLSLEVHPDNIGTLLYAALGVEAAVTDVVEAGVAYTHTFTPVSGGTSLPSLTAIVDKKSDIFTYAGLKIDSLSLETDSSSLLTSSVSFIGQKEELSQSIAVLSNSALNPFDFNTLQLYVGTAGSEAATLVEYVTNFTFNYSNNLENDLFVADGTQYMSEIDYQKRDITLDFEALYNAESNTFREDYYKTGDELSIKAVFTSPHAITDSAADPTNKYQLIIDIHNFVITEAPNSIGGPERLRIPLSGRALEKGGDSAVTISVVDARATKYNV